MAQTSATTKSTETPPKTHVLFMGADLSLEKDKSVHPVEDVTATSLVIKRDGKLVNEPLNQEANIHIGEALKIADTSVAVDNLKTERAYTPGTDPFLKVSQAAAMVAGQEAEADLARGNTMRASANSLVIPDTPEARDSFEKSVAVVAETTRIAASDAQNSVVQTDSAATSHSIAGTTESEQYNAIRLSFNVTADRDLAQAYYAVIAQIRDPGSLPGHVRKWAYVKSLGPISAGSSKKVSFFQGGFPPGYNIEACEVHVYDRSQELATNLSRKRVPLTDEEAHDYRVIEYIGTNKGRSLPVAIAMNSIAANLHTSLTPAQLGKTYYLRVGKDGRVRAAFQDTDAKQSLADPALEAALKTLRFKPALQQGKPVESIAPVRLGQSKSG